jgi:hypothetical protein|tara:strand:+ start:434 stop:790 length:357 start_codon:yes stop_codon:yes gene_type:complete
MAGLSEKIMAAHPTATPLVDFTVEDDGCGDVRIVQWDEAKLGPQPDPSSLSEPSSFQEVSVYSATDIHRITRNRIESEFPVATQLRKISEQDDGFVAMRDRLRVIRKEGQDFIDLKKW